ncbi:MAG TPA: GNAT family N-acetyltransferase [Nocardioidaceae bacterium]|nr:GNAT family N-acetyltransferase [Nocardioidaceae bacterium]
MLELTNPHPCFHRSFLAAADEFIAAGEDRHANLPRWPAEDGFAGVDFNREVLESPERFKEYAAFLVDQQREDTPRPAAYVPCTELWMIADGEYVGRISLRHRLTDLLLTWGGHIGYSVRPTARRRGCASRALALMLPRCAELGIDPVLVTCDTDNVASRRTIETNGGRYEDTREGKLRFWVPTRAAVEREPAQR